MKTRITELFEIEHPIIQGGMHFVGLAGMPRRIPDYAGQFTDFNMIASIGALGFGLSQLLFVYILFSSM